MFDAAYCSHDQQFCIILSGRKVGCLVEMYEMQVMVSATSVALLCNKCEEVVAFQSELFDAGVATATGEFGVLHEQA